MKIKVKSEVIIPASGTSVNETRTHYYLNHSGLERREFKTVESQGDTCDYCEYRDSPDNGKTWGEWVREKAEMKDLIGNDNISYYSYPMCHNICNPVHKHYIKLNIQIIHSGGYEAATESYWETRERGPIYHTFIKVSNEEKEKISEKMIKYEDGEVFDVATHPNDNYLEKNIGIGTELKIAKNGDILIGYCAPVDVCCRISEKDVQKIFPSTPKRLQSFMMCRGIWNESSSEYDFKFSEPLILDEHQSSRGIEEPVISELESGKILVVMRASNVLYPQWNSTISPYAPSFKYYALSNDGGKTFSPPMPWHFDTREAIYSSATYSLLIRSEKNGKLYWIGNIAEPSETEGNFPRFPLNMVEIDEEWGCAKKDTLVVIDTKREGESNRVQLSNFGIIQNRETGNFEITLTKLGQFPERHIRDCETWKYTIEL